MKKGDISILALLSMGIIVLGTVALNIFNPKSQDIRSSAEAQPTLTPIPTTAFSTHCGDTSWSCTVNGVFNCANKDTRDIFDSVYCCGRDRWLYENANNYGNPGSCGGGPSKTKSAGCQPSDYCQDAQTTPTTAQPTTGLTPSATPAPPTSTLAPTQTGCTTPHDWSRCTTIGGEYCKNWGNPSSCGWNGGLAWIDCQKKCKEKPKPTLDPVACIGGGEPCKDSLNAIINCQDEDLIKKYEDTCGKGYSCVGPPGLQKCTFYPNTEFSNQSCKGVPKVSLDCANAKTPTTSQEPEDEITPTTKAQNTQVPDNGGTCTSLYQPQPQHLYNQMCSSGRLAKSYSSDFIPPDLANVREVLENSHLLAENLNGGTIHMYRSGLPSLKTIMDSLLNQYKDNPNACLPILAYAYRSYELQKSLFDGKCIWDPETQQGVFPDKNGNIPEDINQRRWCGVAYPGWSPHQSGSAIDLFCMKETCSEQNGKTKCKLEYDWNKYAIDYIGQSNIQGFDFIHPFPANDPPHYNYLK